MFGETTDDRLEERAEHAPRAGDRLDRTRQRLLNTSLEKVEDEVRALVELGWRSGRIGESREPDLDFEGFFAKEERGSEQAAEDCEEEMAVRGG